MSRQQVLCILLGYVGWVQLIVGLEGEHVGFILVKDDFVCFAFGEGRVDIFDGFEA